MRLAYSDLIESLLADVDAPSYGSILKSRNQLKLAFGGKQATVPLYGAARKPNSRRKTAVKMLLSAGIHTSDIEAIKIIGVLADLGFFERQGGILIGSHAFNAIGYNLGVTWHAGTETHDVDLCRNIDIALSPEARFDAKAVLNQLGFRDVFGLNHRHPPTTFKHDDAEVKVDFLTPSSRRGEELPPVLLPGAGVHAEQMHYMGYLMNNVRWAAIPYKNGILVKVPDAARFALHKCIISQVRPEVHKRNKDLEQAKMIFEMLLNEGQDHTIEEAWSDIPSLRRAKAGLNAIGGDIAAQVLDLRVEETT